MSEISAVVALVVAIAAIISPIFVAVINNAHNTKIKKIDIMSNHKLTAFEHYLSSLKKCCMSKTDDTIKEYAFACGYASIYASNETRAYMGQIDRTITAVSPTDTKSISINKDQYDKLCKSIANDLKIEKYT
jgi:hypothetical protein